jgi:hypothetical protein
MPTFLAPLDLNRNEARNLRTQNLATAPTGPVAGLRYFDTGAQVERYWNGTRWVSVSDSIDVSGITGLGALATLNQVGSTEIADGSIVNADISPSAGIVLSKLAVDPLARANHTGTQLASTVSNFDAQVRTSRLDQMATPTASVSMGGQLITNVATPLSASDAANKAYVDGVASGLDVKDSVRAASTVNVTLSAPGATIDGVAMANGNRVLLKNQSAPGENGIWVWNGALSTMTRAPDADSSAEVTSGLYCLVIAGTQAGTGWILTTPDPITLGTTGLTFAQFSATGATYTGTANRITVTGNQIDIALNYVGQASITTLGTIGAGIWQATPVAVLYGGTGASSAAGARTNLGAIGKYSATFGTGSATTFTINHNLNSEAVTVEIYETATKRTVYADVTRSSVNAIVIDGFTTAPASGALTVVVTG